MAKIAATEFKAKCLELMDRVSERKETYVITKHGRPVAKLVPVEATAPPDIFGYMADQTVFAGDLDKPAWTARQWRQFEKARARQAEAWEGEWQAHGTISGKRTMGQPSRRKRKARQAP